MTEIGDLEIAVPPKARVSARLLRPAGARALLVLGHGAGAGMHHPFMEELATALAEVAVATLRYQFPYMEAGRRAPDRPRLLWNTVRAAVNIAGLVGPGLPLYAGGKSLGGRMTSAAAAERNLHGVEGLVFFGFPLHPIGAPGVERAEHLSRVRLPMLFLQGTRDRLADLSLLRPVLAGLHPPPTLVTIEEADHDFSLPRRLGRGRMEVTRDLAATVADWTGRMPGNR
jgi:predicted alpha/beta-hydrolase family hydrolase